MASKVTCTCGSSWNKSDSSKKDVYVCHNCGKDNTMKNGGWLDKFQEGGIIEDDRGQLEYPGEITKINSNQITMQGVPYNVLGISDTGDTQMMQPGQDYTYEGKSVTEIPMMQNGDKVKRFLNEAKNSIIKGGGNPVSTVVNLVEPSIDLLASTLAPHETIKEREALFRSCQDPLEDLKVDTPYGRRLPYKFS